MRLSIRVFVNGRLKSEEQITVDAETGGWASELVEKHQAIMAGEPGMVEIEFLDEPDVMQRFFRIGTDRSGMVAPLRIQRP